MDKTELDCLLLYTPKLNNFYKLIGSYMFAMQMPMGLFAIADLAEKEGYSTEILHLGIERIGNPQFCLEKYLGERNPRIVGLSLHWHYQTYDVIDTARRIKLSYPDIFIVLGGLSATYFHEEIMEKFGFIDAVIKGDGEIPFLALMKEISAARRDLSSVPNLTWRQGDKVNSNGISYVAKDEDLDGLNFTNFKLLKDHESYVRYTRDPWIWPAGLSKRINQRFILDDACAYPLPIFRGCFTDCSYCGGSKSVQEKISSRTELSVRSIDRVIGSIRDIQMYGYDTIYISYLPIAKNHNYFEKMFERITEEKIKINCLLDCFILPSKRILELFKSTFLDTPKTKISISPESGSERVRRLNKGCFFSNDDLLGCLKYISGLKIYVNLFFTVGLPFEDAGDIAITRNFQKSLKNLFGNRLIIQTEISSLVPSSPMEAYPGKYNIAKTKNSFTDFYEGYSRSDNSFFFPSDPGYFKLNPNLGSGSTDLSAQYRFKRQLQQIRCKDFCRLANYINFSGFMPHRISVLLSTLICNFIGFFWKLRLFNVRSMLNDRCIAHKSFSQN